MKRLSTAVYILTVLVSVAAAAAQSADGSFPDGSGVVVAGQLIDALTLFER